MKDYYHISHSGIGPEPLLGIVIEDKIKVTINFFTDLNMNKRNFQDLINELQNKCNLMNEE